MTKNIFKTLLINIITILSLSYNSLGQGGTIDGIVKDKRTRETLVGAQILIIGTVTGTTTNLNGEFRLSNIRQDKVDLQVSYISYQPVIIEGVILDGSKVVTLTIEMEYLVQQLEGVTVTARRTNYTEVSLIQSIRNSQVVTSGISAQQISRSQDSDAAQVVRRIPGITVMDDRFIVVRGLSERYNSTFLHNTYAPSMEADVRSFSFDMIPSSQIEQLLVFKSPSPDLPGDFAGGAIKVFTKSIPDKSGFEVSYSSQYNDGTSFKPFYITERPKNSWLGLGADYFDLPSDFPSDLRTITNNPDRLQMVGRSLKNNWVPRKNTAYLNHSGSLTGALRFALGNINIGNITTLTYSNGYSTNATFRSDFNAFNRAQNISLPIYKFEDSQYSNNVKVGVIHNWGIEFNDKHSIEFINLFNNISNYSYTNRLGDHIDFGFTMNNHAFQQVFRGLYSGQINGKHEIFPGTKIDWTYGQTYSFREMPDYKQFRSEKPINDRDGELFYIYVPIGGAQPYFMGRFYSTMAERGNTLAFNISQKISVNRSWENNPEIKAGVFSNYLERDFRARNIGYTQSIGFDQGLRAVTIDSLFNPVHINNYGGFKIDEQSNPNDSYDVSNQLFAWYVMLNIPFGKKFNISGGIRIEDNLRKLNSATTAGPLNPVYDDYNILPSVNATFNFTEKLLARAGYGKTLNRPEFREQAPFGFFDFDNNWVITGNPFLRSAEINNFDLRLEYYPSLSEVISLGGFYKTFKYAIERAMLPGAGSGGSKNFTFSNADNAVVFGTELEVRKSFLGLTGIRFIDDLSLYLNAALIYTEVEIGSGTLSGGRDTDPRPLQGQSPYILNIGLFYNNVKSNLEVNLLYNVIGKRIFSGGFRENDMTVSYPDIYEMPRNYIDISISKRISKNLNFRMKIEDILNEPIIFLQDGNQDIVFDKNNDQRLKYNRPGSAVKMGLVFKI